MIQRKQSLYLILGSIIGAISIFFELVSFSYQGEEFSLIKGSMLNGVGEIQFFAYYFIPVLMTACLFGIISIFRFKNLKRQLSSVKINLWLSVLSIAGMIAFIIHASTYLGSIGDFSFSPFVFGPVLLLAFNYLAYKSIKKDNDLLKSVDRIR